MNRLEQVIFSRHKIRDRYETVGRLQLGDQAEIGGEGILGNARDVGNRNFIGFPCGDIIGVVIIISTLQGSFIGLAAAQQQAIRDKGRTAIIITVRGWSEVG